MSNSNIYGTKAPGLSREKIVLGVAQIYVWFLMKTLVSCFSFFWKVLTEEQNLGVNFFPSSISWTLSTYFIESRNNIHELVFCFPSQRWFNRLATSASNTKLDGKSNFLNCVLFIYLFIYYLIIYAKNYISF